MVKVYIILKLLGNLNLSRIVRIARGSGTSIEEVHILLDEHKKLSKVVGNLAKTNLGGKRKLSLHIYRWK